MGTLFSHFPRPGVNDGHTATFADRTLEAINWDASRLALVVRAVNACGKAEDDPPAWKTFEVYLKAELGADDLKRAAKRAKKENLLEEGNPPATEKDIDAFFAELNRIANEKREPAKRPQREPEVTVTGEEREAAKADHEEIRRRREAADRIADDVAGDMAEMDDLNPLELEP